MLLAGDRYRLVSPAPRVLVQLAKDPALATRGVVVNLEELVVVFHFGDDLVEAVVEGAEVGLQLPALRQILSLDRPDVHMDVEQPLNVGVLQLHDEAKRALPEPEGIEQPFAVGAFDDRERRVDRECVDGHPTISFRTTLEWRQSIAVAHLFKQTTRPSEQELYIILT
jgi:hypothetical protein